MGVRLKWNGDRVVRELTGDVDKGVRRAAEVLVAAVRSEAPVLTGQLRDSVHVEKGDKPLQYRVVADAPHAGYVEFGTSRQRANPFFRRGIHKSKAKVAQALAGGGGSIFRRAASAVGRVFGLGG